MKGTVTSHTEIFLYHNFDIIMPTVQLHIYPNIKNHFVFETHLCSICDLLHQNESHVANTVFELADDKRQRGDIYHF